MKLPRSRWLPRSRFEWVRAWTIVLAPFILVAVFVHAVVGMPGVSHVGPPGDLVGLDTGLPDRLTHHVHHLVRIGPRSEDRPGSLETAAIYVTQTLESFGLNVERQTFEGRLGPVANLVVEVRGTQNPREVVVVGAHYDTVAESAGADDNASGVAVLLELGRALHGYHPARTVRLIAFVNEEPPSFREPTMGSLHAARTSLTAQEQMVGMLSLESLGYYRTEPGSQRYPWPLGHFYPDTGDFVAFVGNLASRPLVQRTLGAFREVARIPSEGTAAPGVIPGVGWSDHWAYWQMGFPAVMVTGTAPFRNPGYHDASDRPETLDPVRMAWIVVGLRAVVEMLSNE